MYGGEVQGKREREKKLFEESEKKIHKNIKFCVQIFLHPFYPSVVIQLAFVTTNLLPAQNIPPTLHLIPVQPSSRRLENMT